MRKRTLCLLIVLMMVIPCALAESTAPLAAPPALTTGQSLIRLERYAAWTVEGTLWHVRSNESAAALSQLASEAVGNGVGYFCLEIEGDISTGLIQPCFAFYYRGPQTLNGDTASLVVDAVRYDFLTTHAVETVRGASIEVMRAPLDKASLRAARALLTAQTVRVKLIGDRTYTFTPVLQNTYQTTKAQVEGSSLKGISAMLSELDALDIAHYDLWDLSAARWHGLYGFVPQSSVTVLGGAGQTVNLNNSFELLSREDTAQGVRQLQELLLREGYMQGRADGSFGEGTDRAVRAARRYWGLMECGIADQSLIDCLTGAGKPVDTSAGREAELAPFGEVCGLTLKRCWFASAITAGGGATYSAENADNTLLIVEGEIENLSGETMAFYRQLQAEASCGAARFSSLILCEADDGRRFDTSLLPLGRARIVFVVEAPERAALLSGWKLSITCGGETLDVNLGV